MIKLLAFDLDGTLTQHRTQLSDENKAVLDKLSEKYKLLMVGAGRCERIFEQMGRYPIDIIGNYGLQFSKYDEKTKSEILVRDLVFDCNREEITRKVTYLRNKYGFTDYKGDSVEFHPSGCVTFPILGTRAVQEVKLAFDPDRRKRRAIYKEVCELFSEYTVFVGGSSSFDMAPKPYNKYYALSQYCKGNGYSHSEVVFVGDDYGEGGNDESVYLSDISFRKVDDYRDFSRIMEDLL